MYNVVVDDRGGLPWSCENEVFYYEIVATNVKECIIIDKYYM